MASTVLPRASESIVDILNGLLEGHQGSVFPFVLSSSPHLGKANVEIHQLLQQMHEVCERQERELVALIGSLGGKARLAGKAAAQDSYLPHLSLKFLLPTLVNEKDLLLRRYENARNAVSPEEFPEVYAELKRIEDEQCELLGRLKKAAREVTDGKFEPPTHSDRCPEPAK
jgi:hypothetical protein